ncbi:conserved hypothetical protein, partial [Ricinus communis]
GNGTTLQRHPDRQRDDIPVDRIAAHGRHLQRRAVAEHVVGRIAHRRQVARAGAVRRRCISLVQGRHRERELRGLDAVGGARRLREARVNLEVDVRHAARVAAREDRRERDGARAVRLLHAAQVVLARQAARVHRVIAVAVAVPQ